MSEPEEYLVLKQLTDALDDLKIDYAIGGSIASSLYGKVRFTQDADITVAAFAVQSQTLDTEYLRNCSEQLGLSDILQKAIDEPG